MNFKHFFFLLTLFVFIIGVGNVGAVDIYSSNSNAQTYITSNTNLTINTYNQTWVDFNLDGNLSINYSSPTFPNITNNYSLSFWLNPHSKTNYKIIMAKEKSFEIYWDGSTGANKIRFTQYNTTSSYNLDTASSIPLDTWSHFVFIYDGVSQNRTQIFQDGSLRSGTSNAIKGYNSSSLFDFYIGGKLNQWDFNGSIDEFQLRTEVLDYGQLARLYNSSSRKLGQSIPVLSYHQIKDPADASTIVNVSYFSSQMSYLNSSGFHTITFSDYYNWKYNSYQLPTNPIIITFDDSNLNVYTNATPIMDIYGFVGVLSTISSGLNAPTSINNTQLLELHSKGWEIFSHSVNHSDMLLMNLSEINNEFNLSKIQIENNLSISINGFTYPFNSHNSTLDSICSNYYTFCGFNSFGDVIPEYIYNSTNLTGGLNRIVIDNETTPEDFAQITNLNSALVISSKFDENIGNISYDSSGYSNNAIINGTFWDTDGIIISHSLNPVLSASNNLMLSPANLIYSWIVSKTHPTPQNSILLNNTDTISYDLEIYNLTNALIYNTNGSVYGSTTISNNDGNVNITLNAGNSSYVLDNFNLTEGTTRQNSPLWFISSSLAEKQIGSNLTDTIITDISFTTGSCAEVGTVNYTSHTGTYKHIYYPGQFTCNGNVLTVYNVEIEPAQSSNTFLISYASSGVQVPSNSQLYFNFDSPIHLYLFFFFLGLSILLFFMGKLQASASLILLNAFIMFFNGVNFFYSSIALIFGLIILFSAKS